MGVNRLLHQAVQLFILFHLSQSDGSVVLCLHISTLYAHTYNQVQSNNQLKFFSSLSLYTVFPKLNAFFLPSLPLHLQH